VRRRLYISTGWGNRAEAQRAALLAEAQGWEITYKWWTHHERDFDHRADRMRIATAEWEAIVTSRAVLVILPGGRGTHVELGMALAQGRPVVMVAKRQQLLENGAACAFHDLAEAHASNIEEGLRLLAAAFPAESRAR
jgi:nucleoside 2-deoxyribosyltransferase